MSTPVLHFSAQAKAGVYVDLEKLVAGRLLLQGSSGAGKSWLIRYLLEQTYGRIQHFVFDPEGELVTLREKFDYIVVSAGGDGDIPADPATADLLCRHLVRLQLSAIFDLSELDPEEREEFVGNFLNRLVNLPREQWRSALVVVDEAHELCPLHGKPPSRKPMELVVSKGRKRGLGAIYCTQRLSKLSKNASDLQNILVGYTGLDVDVQRAGDMLGFDKVQREELTRLDHEFFAFGPALSTREVVRVRSGPATTHHPEPGEVRPPTPPAGSELQALIAELAAASAAEKPGDEEASDAPGARPPAGWVSPAEVERRIREAVAAERAQRAEYVARAIDSYKAECYAPLQHLQHVIGNGWKPPEPGTEAAPEARAPAPERRPTRVKAALEPRARRENLPAGEGSGLSLGERQVLTAVAQHTSGVTREQLTVLTGYRRSTRDTYLQRLGARGLVMQEMGTLRATDVGVQALGSNFEKLPTGDRLRTYWFERLSGGELKVLQTVCHHWPESVDREEISKVTGYARSSRDTYLQKLSARRLVISDRAGVRAADELFTRRVRR